MCLGAYPDGMTSSGIIWLALDGVGHPLDAPVGSVWEQDLPALRPLVDAGLALDATLDVPGLPQSGTGQACWLTGQDAVRVMGERSHPQHFGPHPGPTLQRLLREHSLPVRLAWAGARVALVNSYAPQYFGAQGKRNRMGCFPFSFQAANLPLNPPDMPLVRASLGLNFQAPWTPSISIQEVARSAEALALKARDFDLVVADLWFSDLLGHAGRDPTPPDVLHAGFEWMRRLDAFLTTLLDAEARVVITSDHGNFEDLTVKAHTLARVPFAGAGVKLHAPGNVVQGGQVIAGWFGLDSGEDIEI